MGVILVRPVGQVNVEAGAFAGVLVGRGLSGKVFAEAGRLTTTRFLLFGVRYAEVPLHLALRRRAEGSRSFLFNGGTFAAFGIHGVEIDDVGFALCLNKCGHLYCGVAEMQGDARGGVLRFGIEEGAADAV